MTTDTSQVYVNCYPGITTKKITLTNPSRILPHPSLPTGSGAVRYCLCVINIEIHEILPKLDCDKV